MLRFIALAIVLAVVSAGSDDSKKKCMRLGHPHTMICCKAGFPKPKVDAEELKECMDIPRIPHTCDHDICIAKKRGYASSDDGDIDMDAFEKVMAEDFSDFPDLIAAIKNNCINGDLDEFRPAHHKSCQLITMKRCLHKQAIKECKEWDDSGSCAGLKDLVKECEALMS